MDPLRPTTSWTDLVVSRDQARAAGHTDAELRALLSSGRWTALRRGHYCATADLEAATPARRFHLELLALHRHLDRPHAVVSHGTAGRLHGLRLPRSDDVHRLTDPDRWRTGRGYRMSRATLPATEVTRLGPFPATTAARTLVDSARELAEVDAVAALDDALLRGLVTRGQLRAVLAGAPTHRGTPAARRAVDRADGRSESWLETAWRLRHLAAGLPAPQLQVEIWIGGRLVKVVDGWLPEHALAFECDGKVKYTDPYGGRTPAEVLWAEKRAEDALRAVGIRVVRLVTRDVLDGWPALAERTRWELASPVPALRAFQAVPRARGRARPRAAVG
jgi:hypothetical protein